jgi:hypothetical protein
MKMGGHDQVEIFANQLVAQAKGEHPQVPEGVQAGLADLLKDVTGFVGEQLKNLDPKTVVFILRKFMEFRGHA